jgi:hypothetical protein
VASLRKNASKLTYAHVVTCPADGRRSIEESEGNAQRRNQPFSLCHFSVVCLLYKRTELNSALSYVISGFASLSEKCIKTYLRALRHLASRRSIEESEWNARKDEINVLVSPTYRSGVFTYFQASESHSIHRSIGYSEILLFQPPARLPQELVRTCRLCRLFLIFVFSFASHDFCLLVLSSNPSHSMPAVGQSFDDCDQMPVLKLSFYCSVSHIGICELLKN